MRKNIFLAAVLALFFVIVGGCSAAPKPSADGDDTLAGNWTGESLCQVKNSPCHDEKVIYRITAPDAAGKMQIQADKIVDGKPEFMATLDCTFTKTDQTVVCQMDKGVWNFTVKDNQMNGTLTLTDGTLYRKISVEKAKQ